MTINSAEGVIKFGLAFNHGPPQELETIAELNAWRQIIYRLGLTGCDPARYQGLAYGNVSRRTGTNSFIISGTQTGMKPYLSPSDYCLVLDFDLGKNRVWAQVISRHGKTTTNQPIEMARSPKCPCRPHARAHYGALAVAGFGLRV